MTLITFAVEMVIAIHDDILNPGDLPGLALDKSLAGVLGRVENRLAYGLITDAFDLAAAYAVAISQGHCFNDGNKRTAFRCMEAALALNGHILTFETEEVGQIIIRTAQRQLDEGTLAEWLRDRILD